MAANMLSERSVNYLSQRSADVVLSEVRPTKLSPEALRSINVLLDELLWMILSSARSFSTDRLKSAFAKLIPTTLGKEALLEAEMELKLYLDRTASAFASAKPYVENTQEFPLQPAFELLRLKCEAYTTLNDTDEDTGAENRWQAKIIQQAGFSSQNIQYIATSALYMTAIIEFACEHILSNTSRVTSRDSSRSIASIQDLYVALCEDGAIYGTFKNMKVHSQIETQSKSTSSHPRRSKSIHRENGNQGRFPSNNMSPATSAPGSETDFNVGSSSKAARQSSESSASGTAGGPHGSRPSIEKSRAKKFFGRTSVDKESSQNGHDNSTHKRNESVISNGRRSTTPYDDGASSSPGATEVEFDELMRSGTTMKVSLTPDRLRTFELYKQEKGQRRQGLSTATNLPLTKVENEVDDTVQFASDASALKNGPSIMSRPPQVRSVDSIMEDEENGAPLPNSHEKNGIRVRKESKGSFPPPPPPSSSLPSARSRSKSASASTASVSNGRNLARKSSLNALLRATAPPVPAKMSYADSDPHPVKRHRGPRKDSIDDILNGSSDEEEVLPPKSTFQPKGAHGSGGTTRDLISFLNDGPPDIGPVPSVTSFQSSDSRVKQGRFRSMVTKLTRGGSSERLVSGADAPGKRSLSNSHPPPSYVPPLLSAKKSLATISTFDPAQVESVAPTDRLYTSTMPPLSLTVSPGRNFSEMLPESPSRMRTSPITARKAVPSFDQSALSKKSSASSSLAATTTALSPSRDSQTSPVTPTKSSNSISSKDRQQSPLFTTVKSETNIVVPSGSPVTTTAREKPVKAAKPADIIVVNRTNDNGEESHVSPLLRPKRTSSIDKSPPSPIRHKHQVSSKAAQRHALSPPVTPSQIVFASHAREMRRLMASASNADECRLLVDMFLAQAGLPIRATDCLPDTSKEPNDQQQAHVVETLLGHDADISLKHLLRKESFGTDVSVSETSLPTPQSISHPSMTTIPRKPVPSDFGNFQSPALVAEA